MLPAITTRPKSRSTRLHPFKNLRSTLFKFSPLILRQRLHNLVHIRLRLRLLLLTAGLTLPLRRLGTLPHILHIMLGLLLLVLMCWRQLLGSRSLLRWLQGPQERGQRRVHEGILRERHRRLLLRSIWTLLLLWWRLLLPPCQGCQ